MYVFQQVPQLHLLTHCDLMITLGGMNSIEECIEMEVPMLVCPMSLKTDQLGNSAMFKSVVISFFAVNLFG